jgi:hypothetical protein
MRAACAALCLLVTAQGACAAPVTLLCNLKSDRMWAQDSSGTIIIDEAAGTAHYIQPGFHFPPPAQGPSFAPVDWGVAPASFSENEIRWSVRNVYALQLNRLSGDLEISDMQGNRQPLEAQSCHVQQRQF